MREMTAATYVTVFAATALLALAAGGASVRAQETAQDAEHPALNLTMPRAPVDSNGVELPLPDHTVPEPAPTTSPKLDGPLIKKKGLEAGVTGGDAPSAYTWFGDGPLRTEAEVGGSLDSPADPAQARIGTYLNAPVGDKMDLRLGPSAQWNVPNPMMDSTVADTGPDRSVDLQTGLDLSRSLSINARSEYTFESLAGSDRELGEKVSTPLNSELMMRYNLGW